VGSGTLTCNSVVMADTTNDNRDSEIDCPQLPIIK
jgi:hypothetical protein